MKKLIAFVITLMLIFTCIPTYAALPDYMTKTYNNYSSDGTISIEFSNAQEVVEYLETAYPDEEIISFLDLKSILSSMLSLNSTIKAQANISDDYKKIQFATTTNYFYDAVISNNLSVDVNATSGMWINIDMTPEVPVFEIIYLYPYSNKYIVRNVFAELSDEDIPPTIAIMKLLLNEEFIGALNATYAQLMEKHAKITTTDNVCTIEMDNASFIAFLEDLFAVLGAKISQMLPILKTFDESASVGIIGGADGPTAIYTTEDSQAAPAPEELFPSLEGVRILGENGFVSKTTLVDGNPATSEAYIDISVNLSELMGDAWESEQPLNLDFEVKLNTNMSDFGTTTVNFPELTPENFIDYKVLNPVYDNEYSGEYPNPYPYFTANEAFVQNGEYYIPLRATMESVYNDQLAITVEDGNIILESEWFTEFDKLTLRENSTVAFADDTELTLSQVIEKNGVAYVSTNLLEQVFGWVDFYIRHDLIKNNYYISFSTQYYEYEENEIVYPYYYAYIYTDQLPVIDGKYYVPLRSIIEYAYDDQATLSYSDGVVTLESEWFPGFRTLTLTEGSEYAQKDGETFEIDPIIIKDWTTYVSIDFFVKEFGWKLLSLEHDVIQNSYTVEFATDRE